MEHWIAILVGVLIAAGSYLVLREDAFRRVVGFAVLGTGANLLLLTVGRVTPGRAPIVPAGQDALVTPFANPLSQALILTAIVIGFGLVAYLMALTRATCDEAHAASRLDGIDKTDDAAASYLLDVVDAPPNLSRVAAVAKKEERLDVTEQRNSGLDSIRTVALEGDPGSVSGCSSER